MPVNTKVVMWVTLFVIVPWTVHRWLHGEKIGVFNWTILILVSLGAWAGAF